MWHIGETAGDAVPRWSIKQIHYNWAEESMNTHLKAYEDALVELVSMDEDDRPKRKIQAHSYRREEKRDAFPRKVAKYSRKSGKSLQVNDED